MKTEVSESENSESDFNIQISFCDNSLPFESTQKYESNNNNNKNN